MTGSPIRAGSAAQSEIDTPREERRESPELLGNHQWGVIRQHDAAGANANRAGRVREVRDDDSGRGGGDPRHVVVLGYPIAAEAPSLGMLGQVEAVV